MKNLFITSTPFDALFNNLKVLAICLCLGVGYNVSTAQNGPDCSKICFEFAGASVGGPICTGEAGAVPAGATVTISDPKGNKTTAKANANGSFGANCSNLVCPVGTEITITVNGKKCTVKSQRPNTCNNNNQGTGGGEQGCRQMDSFFDVFTDLVQRGCDAQRRGDTNGAKNNFQQARDVNRQMDQILTEMIQMDLRPNPPGGGITTNPNAGNQGGGGNVIRANNGPDCSKICYEYGAIAVGGPICMGKAGAVPGGATVTITDSKGNKATTTAKADGSFGANCSNIVAPIGSEVTISVNGKTCTVKVQRPNSCN